MLCLVVVVVVVLLAVEMFDVGRWLGAVRVQLVFLYLYQSKMNALERNIQCPGDSHIWVGDGFKCMAAIR